MRETMGKIFVLMGKSSTGKDTIYQKVMQTPSLQLERIVPYTTRPVREGEKEGISYHFVTIDKMNEMDAAHQIIECRNYHTVHGVWSYFTAKDDQIDLEKKNYLIIGTIESYLKMKEYFGEESIIPVYIDLDDGERLTRALFREKEQIEPKYEEMCRRFLADQNDFNEEKIKQAGIKERFYNQDLMECTRKIVDYIEGKKG